MKLTKNLKKGIVVELISGSDKGKSGEILSMVSENHCFISGINSKKHKKPTQQSPGEVTNVARKIHISNVKVVEQK